MAKLSAHGKELARYEKQIPVDKHLVICYPIIIHKQERDNMKRIKQHHKVYKQRFRIRPTKVETPLPKKKLKYKDYYLQDDYCYLEDNNQFFEM